MLYWYIIKNAMKKVSILILSLVLLSGTSYLSAQSFKERFKRATEKIGREIIQGASQKSSQKSSKKSGNNSSHDSELQKRHDAMVGAGNNKNAEDEAPTVRLPKNHTALFAPLGYPTEAKYGIKSAKPVMPPKAAADQVNWSEKLPNVYELDNQSLVNEFVMLDDCFADGYIKTLTPAHWRYDELVKGELLTRVDALNEMVAQYNEAQSEYGSDSPQWVINGIHNKIASILDGRAYKTLIRSSLVPLFTLKGKYISDETKEYFKAHGGYENAIKANMTVWDPQPNKKSVMTSSAGVTGKVISENGSGATVDIDGVQYVLHNSNNGGASHAFISELATTAVANKDIVIPDYVTYNGRKYPVRNMRANIFSKTTIKSVKLPSTLTEISNSAFRETPITEIIIPASVKIVQGSAFYGCKNLTKVVFESNAMEEVHGCFQKCVSLKSVKFPGRVGVMSYDMFEGCVNLTEVILPENLSEIYQSMFEGCKSLKNVDIPSGVTKVGASAFSDSGITSLDLSNVKEFGGDCFSGCKALKTVRLNSSLKDDFLMETYDEFMGCPLLEVKYVNNEYVFPDGFIFVNGK